MNKQRVILHSDINHCYAQIEEMLNPRLKEVPMVVGGNEKARHGIILAKNLHAKKFHIQTAETLRDALKKCPDLYIVAPQMKKYEYYTEQVKDIYREYTDKVESFGLDEAWIDVTESISLFGSGLEIAREIQNRVLTELGLTISIGVSFNKIFSKLGSDIIKPSGLVEITKENYQELVWQMPVEDLLMVGRATKPKLTNMGIHTIGDLANTSIKILEKRFGKMGVLLWGYANGAESGGVTVNGHTEVPKSVGNSWTTPKDINNFREAHIVLKELSDSVASRLRNQFLKGDVISLTVRDKKLFSFVRQIKIGHKTDLSRDILNEAMSLLHENYDFSLPIRSMGISVSHLVPAQEHLQLNLFEDSIAQEKYRNLEIVVDQIKTKFGNFKLQNVSALLDVELSGVNPREDHTVFPVGFLKGGQS